MHRTSFQRRIGWNGRSIALSSISLLDSNFLPFSRLLVIFLFVFSVQACAASNGRRDVISSPITLSLPAPPEPEQTARDRHQTVQIGEASWYGPRFHGKLTSSGEVYNQYSFTAAHPTLPEGSTVEVTNLDNGKSVMLRVNDRGPFVKGRIIDVSQRAAEALRMIEKGTAKVQVIVRSRPKQSQ